ncbi:hypothetical protein D3C76_1757560 [compost metagenome]
MGRAEAGQTENTLHRLLAKTQRLLRGDKRQPRLTHRLLTVQPPQAFTQRQRLDLLQHPGKSAIERLCEVQ